jgi:hypothetical protein
MLEKLRFYIHSLLGSLKTPPKGFSSVESRAEQRLFEINLISQDKLKAYKEWSKPENILARMAKLDAEAVIALDRGKAMSEAAKMAQLGCERIILDPVTKLSNIGIKVK